jgi:hypothetical protein
LPGEIYDIGTNKRNIKRSTRRFLPNENFELIPGRRREHFISIVTRHVLRYTKPPNHGITGALSREISGRGVKLTTHPPLASRLRISEAIPPVPHTSSINELRVGMLVNLWCHDVEFHVEVQTPLVTKIYEPGSKNVHHIAKGLA